MSTKVVQWVLSFLSGLDGTGSTPIVEFSKSQFIHYTDTMVVKMDKALGIDVFLSPMFGSKMTSTKHELVINFYG